MDKIISATYLIFLVNRIQIGETSYLSYKKPTASSAGESYGVTDGNDHAILGYWCYHSDWSSNEWVRVDLLKKYEVSKVTVINRISPTYLTSTRRLTGAEVRISLETDIGSGDVCGSLVNEDQVELSPIIDFSCQPKINGQYVTLRYPYKSSIINICEIRVYSENQPEISECIATSSGEDYRGLVAITQNGRVCQDWTSNATHTHTVNQDPNKGIGRHNLCRNPDNKSQGPWCYTTDPAVEWEYCDVAETNVSCPLKNGSFLNPVVNLSADIKSLLLLPYHYRPTTTLNLPNGIATCIPESISEIKHVDIYKWSFKRELFNNETNSLTLAFHILPGFSSLGPIIKIGSSNIYLSLEQTWSNIALYPSEITVFYQEEEMTRAYVLQPDVWTSIAVTFDGQNKNIKLWRDGEIASIGYTTFTRLDFQHNYIDLELGTTNNAKMSMIEVYDRVLNEVEVKASRDLPIQFEELLSYTQLTFVKLSPDKHLTGHRISEHHYRSFVDCCHLCLRNRFCEGFGLKTEKCFLLTCCEESSNNSTDNVIYYQKIPVRF